MSGAEILTVGIVLVILFALGALVFGGWVLVVIGRFAFRLLGGLFGAHPAGVGPPPHFVRCPHARCMADNPHSARFCRRCGKVLRPGETLSIRRAG